MTRTNGGVTENLPFPRPPIRGWRRVRIGHGRFQQSRLCWWSGSRVDDGSRRRGPMQARMMKGAPVAGMAMEMDAAMPAAAPAGGAAEVEMIVRRMWATAFWEPALQTDQNGEA